MKLSLFLPFVILILVGCDNISKSNLNNISNTIDTTIQSDAIENTYIDNSIEIKDNDTISIHGYTLTFKKIDSTLIPDLYSDQPIRRRLMDTIGNSHQAAQAIENYLAGKLKNYFTTTDSVLTLYLDGNKTLTFPKWDSQKDEGYNFEHYFKEIDYFLLHVQWGEGNCWMLVNRKNGFKKYIIGHPYISPSGQKILTINKDLEAGFSDNGFELLSVSGDTLKTEFNIEPKDWGPTAVKWLTENRLIVKKTSFSIDSISNDLFYSSSWTEITLK